MALKFLNKKGWHTGSLRNIENVWKAEQKHDAEQKKLEELRKQIHEERERAEFRLLQEQAGIVPKQERLEFLYDSGLAVGKGSSSGGFKSLESSFQKNDSSTATASPSPAPSSSEQQQTSVPGALFEDKPQSANDAWRKLHSDPLLLIRQREQEALARIKNNPIKMSMILKSVESTKNKEKHDKEPRKKHHKDDDNEPSKIHHHRKHRKHSSKDHSDLENDTLKEEARKKASSHKASYSRNWSSDYELSDEDGRRRRSSYKDLKHRERRSSDKAGKAIEKGVERQRKTGNYDDIRREHNRSEGRAVAVFTKEKDDIIYSQKSQFGSSDPVQRHDPTNTRKNPVRLSDEERAARLREMQMDAEVHEGQRWKRLKKAEENDAREAVQAHTTGGRSFLDAVQKSVYGTENGGSSTIEESVRRRTHYLQGRSDGTEGKAFRR